MKQLRTTLGDTIGRWARQIKHDGITLWFAWRHADAPLLVRGLCLLVVAYALSPIDLVPDFIPVLGYVDDALLLPGLIWLSLQMLPEAVIRDSRVRADLWFIEHGRKPRSYSGAALIAGLWVLAAYSVWRWLAPGA